MKNVRWIIGDLLLSRYITWDVVIVAAAAMASRRVAKVMVGVAQVDVTV